MYNRVGVQTPRGTGTSGYVQANMSYRRKIHSKLDFLKELRRLRENQLKPDNKPDENILEHNKRRAIYLQLRQLREDLVRRGKSAEYIEKKIKKKEKKLLKEFKEKGDIGGRLRANKKKQKDDHARAEEKQKQLERMKEAFGLEKMGYKEGTAFDFELQEKEKLERVYQRKLKKFERKQLRIEEEERKAFEAERKIEEEKKEKVGGGPEMEIEQEPEPEGEIKLKGDFGHEEKGDDNDEKVVKEDQGKKMEIEKETIKEQAKNESEIVEAKEKTIEDDKNEEKINTNSEEKKEEHPIKPQAVKKEEKNEQNAENQSQPENMGNQFFYDPSPQSRSKQHSREAKKKTKKIKKKKKSKKKSKKLKKKHRE